MSDTYPECVKLAKLDKEHSAVVEFFEYLDRKEYFICEASDQGFRIVLTSVQKLFYDMYCIDEKKLEEERSIMIQKARESQ